MILRGKWQFSCHCIVRLDADGHNAVREALAAAQSCKELAVKTSPRLPPPFLS